MTGGLIWLLKALIKLYQWGISPWLGPNCRFHPSCSNYAQTCLSRFGLIKAVGLILNRLSRCHAWGKNTVHEGLDLPPEKPPLG